MLNEDYTPAPCRSIFTDGEWKVPPGERPPDWMDRTTARNDAPTKAPYVCVREGIQPKARLRSPAQGFQVGHPKYGGRRKSAAYRRVKLTPAEIVARLEAGETMYTLGKALQCNISWLYCLVKKAGLSLPPRKCQDCGGLTGKRAHAKYCATCATARWRGWKALAQAPALARLAQGSARCLAPCCKALGLYAKGFCATHYHRQRKGVTHDSI